MTLSKKISLILGILMFTSLLSACASLLEPKHITIEYDEEVKLHNGEMIWVHITRHYLEGGKEISEMFRGSGKNVIPTEVEISWDTGFEGVGRKSVFFNEQVFLLDKYNNIWYVSGVKNHDSTHQLSNSINCNKVGYFSGDIGCRVSVNSQGEFIIKDLDILKDSKMNILYPIGIRDWGLIPRLLDKNKVTWNQKLELQESQDDNRKLIGKSL